MDKNEREDSYWLKLGVTEFKVSKLDFHIGGPEQ